MCRQGVGEALFRVTGGGRFFFSQGLLHLRHAGFQRLEVGARALQYVGLHVEFLARHEVEPGKHAGKQGADVFFDVGSRAGGDDGAQVLAEFVEEFGVDHGGAFSGERNEKSRKSSGKESSTRFLPTGDTPATG